MRQPRYLGVVRKREGIDDWFERLQRGKLAVDTETTGLDWTVDLVGGLCLASGETAAYFCRDALAPAIKWLAREVRHKRPLVGHNLKFDLHMLRRTFGLHVPYPCDDVMIQSFLLDNRGCPRLGTAIGHDVYGRGYGGHELKSLATVYVDPQAKDAETRLTQAMKAAGGRRKGDILMAPSRVVGEYGALDAWYTLRLDALFTERLRYWVQPHSDDMPYPSLWSLYENERWLLLALRDMEERGIAVDPPFFEEWKQRLTQDIEKTKRNLSKLAGGREINWNSPPQLRTLLFDKLRLRPTRWTKRGLASTDEVTLLDLKHPIGAELLRLRDFQKQHGTYASGLLEAVVNGRIHPSFRQIGAETGRLSCADPNLQQVPRESGARRGFRPDKGLVLRFADYSQIEMRFAAHLADDPTLVNGFRNDPDFDTHSATAKKMWGLHEEPTARQRKFAKIMNFSILYGAGLKKIASSLVSLLSVPDAIHALKEFNYTPKPGEPPHLALAHMLRVRYFKEFPRVRQAARRSQELAEQRGLAMNLFGRHRFLEDGKEYTAFNTEDQGSAADQAKFGLVNLYRELQLGEGTIGLMLQIHDEAVYVSDGDPKTDRRVLELLQDTTRFRVPIIADVSGSTTTWQDKKKIELATPNKRRKVA